MSVKQWFQQAVDALPETVTVEEAFERLYSAFRSKQAFGQGQRMSAILEKLAGRGGPEGISDPAGWEREVRQDRPLPGRDP